MPRSPSCWRSLLVLAGVTRAGSWLIERRNPPVGELRRHRRRPHPLRPCAGARQCRTAADRLHPRRQRQSQGPDAAAAAAARRPRRNAVPRPARAIGWSGRGPGNNETPSAQANTIAALMDRLGIKQGDHRRPFLRRRGDGRLRLRTPGQDARPGLPVGRPRHPWPGGATSWYYSLTTIPVLGWLFSETSPIRPASLRMDGATTCVFAPNKVPDELCRREPRSRWCCGPALSAPTPSMSQASIASRSTAAPRYREIKAPTVVISGDRDKVVYEEIHSVGLARDIPGAELVWVHNLGHKPDWIAPDLVVGGDRKAGRQARRPAGDGQEPSKRGSPATPTAPASASDEKAPDGGAFA